MAIILITALLPVAILIYYIYKKDSQSPEPVGQLVKAFFYGVLSVPLSLCISYPLQLMGVYYDEPYSFLGCVNTAFFGAAIPEEIAKLIMLWLVLRKNPYFDETMDGIVYAVCVSLGFAALENIMYLFENVEDFLAVGLTRAIFAIPGHFCFGIIMGYFYSLAKFYPKSPHRNKILILVAPILAHGIYDSILFVSNIAPAISGILMIVFLYFCNKLWKFASKKINENLQRDSMIL